MRETITIRLPDHPLFGDQEGADAGPNVAVVHIEVGTHDIVSHAFLSDHPEIWQRLLQALRQAATGEL